VQDLDRLLLRVRDPSGWAPFFSVEGLSPRWAEPVREGGGFPFVRGDLFAVMVIMTIMHVRVEEPPYQD
jgi:hypothetical protein